MKGKGSGKGSGLEKSFFTFLLLNSFADRSVVNPQGGSWGQTFIIHLSTSPSMKKKSIRLIFQINTDF